MSDREKSVASMNRKIREGRAVVLTCRELMAEIRKARGRAVPDVDIVTAAFRTEVSGTAAMLCVPVAEKGVFTRAEKIWLNGIPGLPGPAPNERLGVVDTLVFSTQTDRNERQSYDGAMLLKDIIGGKEIQAECLSVEGDIYRSTFTIAQLEFARMYVYNCLLGWSAEGDRRRLIESGYVLKATRVGSKVLLNKAPGIVVGCGTRTAAGQGAISLAADMFEMDPDFMIEVGTGSGTAMTNSVALAVPVLEKAFLDDLSRDVLNEGDREVPEGPHDNLESGMAGYLKELVIRGKFLLTYSDMEI